MDQNLANWLRAHQAEIQDHWWAKARDVGLISPEALEKLAQESALGRGFFLQLLASLEASEAPDPVWVATLAKEIDQSDLLALLSALRQVLFELLVGQTEPQRFVERWRVLDQSIDRLGLGMVAAFENHLVDLEADREHWQALYQLTQELSRSIDLSYDLQNTLTRTLGMLETDRGAVLLLDSETGQVKPRATLNWQDASLDQADLPPEWQRGYGSPLVVKAGDAEGSTFKPCAPGETGTVICAPLLANGQFHGILAVATSDDNGFDEGQRGLIDAVATNLALNLGRSQVIQTLNDQARELGVMLRQHQEESSKREAILASIADGVVYNDQLGRIVLVNRAAEQILSRRAQDLIGRDLKDLFRLFTAGPRTSILEAMRAILTTPQADIPPEAFQTVLQIDNRTISAHLASVVTEGDEFLGIVTVFRDITKEVEADQAKSEFVSTVSHELRTPMTAIKGYTDLIYSGAVGEINDNQKRFLGIVQSNTERLTALISDLLDISRVETGRVRFEPEPVQLGDIVKNVIDALAPNAEDKGHSLNLKVEPDLPEIMGDPNRLNQVFTNLVGNSIKYTPEDGEVYVAVYSVGEAVRADVRDNGIGIYSEDLSKIFDRFYRADHPLVQESRGSGLGLSIVKMFVEMHGGRVWAESGAGTGSTFTVLLPLPTAQEEVEPGLLSPEVGVMVSKRHVLVADDDPDIATLIKLQLEEAGYRVTVVGRGAKVLESAREACPDLIVLDILLPDMDGRFVLETLKSEPATSDIPVVMLTIVADDGTAFDLGAADYLTKPVDAERLQDAVRAALARRGRILVVEDDVDTIEMMRLALRRVGYNVDVAADGYEALTLARRWRPQTIVLDLRLPGMDGYEALSHLKRNPGTHDIPIIVTSAHVADSEKEEKRLKALGVTSFLPKPFTVNQLVTRIDRVTGTVRRAK
jgi:PAS domain S-box-containing protein